METFQLNLIVGLIKSRIKDWRIMWHAMKKIEINTGFGFENKKERDYLKTQA